MEMKRPIGIGRLLVSFVLAASLCLATIPGQADIYRWQDEEGNWHFSDSPTSEAPIEKPPILTQTNPRPDKHSYTPESPAAGSLLPGMSPASPKEAPSPSSAPSDTASIQGGLLWRIDGAAAGESYLLGTIHSSDPRVVRLRPSVSQALDRSERFIMEMEMDTSALMAFGANMMLTDGRDLEGLLGTDLYARVIAAMSDLGMPEMVVRTLKPWAVMALLSMPKPSGEPFLDLVLQQRAAGAGKATAGLETAQEQLSVFDNLSMSDQIELLKMTMAQLPELPRMFDQLIEAYATNDLGRIATLAAQYKSQGNVETLKRFMLRLNDERNRRMARRMEPYINQGNSFIAVGALHLPGPNGLIQLLRNQGYQVVSVR